MRSADGAVQHVLMTADTLGGVWTYALELSRGLARFGVRTTLATMGEPLRADQRAAAEAVPDLHVIESTFRLEWMGEPWRDVALAGEWLLSIEGRERPDVVHLNGYAHGALPWYAPRVVVAHSCVESWWRAVFGESAPADYDRYRKEVARGVQAADALVAPTEAMLQALREAHRLSRPSCVIHNGIEATPYAWGRKWPFILTAGRLWDAAKNIRALESVAPRLRWPVYVAGSDREPEGRGDERATGRTRALGLLSARSLRTWMSRAAIYAAPAKYEPFGLSILEAALSGCALVVGDIASLREVWQDAAVYVSPDDPEALVEALERLSSDAAARERMSALAWARARRFTAARQARSYLALYRELVSRRSEAAVLPCG